MQKFAKKEQPKQGIWRRKSRG